MQISAFLGGVRAAERLRHSFICHFAAHVQKLLLATPNAAAVGGTTVVGPRGWLLCGVQLKVLLAVLEVLRSTALACVMGNVVEVERAQKAPSGGAGLESFEDKAPAHVQLLV